MSEYPVLDNRSIDQWKVSELKEELKRRKMNTRGLKVDLIGRLDEALCIERENDEKADLDPEPIAGMSSVETVSVTETTKEPVDHGDNVNEKVDDVAVHVDISNNVAAVSAENVKTEIEMSGNDSNRREDELVAYGITVETNNEVSGIMVSESVGTFTKQDLQSNNSNENGHLKLPLESEDFVHHVDNESSITHVGYGDSISHVVDRDLKHQLENESLKFQREDPVLDFSAPGSQVSEVSSALGFQVISDSISTDTISVNEKIELKVVNLVSEVSHAFWPEVRSDSISSESVSINETIELRDNIYAEDVNLELNLANLEMVGPSSSPVSGKSHPMDVEKPDEERALTDNNDANSDINRKIDSADVGYSEKLNFDRSSGNDSIKEDAVESKQSHSEYNSNGTEDTIEKNEVPTAKEGSCVDVVGNGLSYDRKDLHLEKKDNPAMSSEKRKIHDGVEPMKRQRRWNLNSANLSEPKSSNLTPLATSYHSFELIAVKQNMRSDLLAGQVAPKQRVVPPSPKHPSTSLRIDNFLRPFTLKALQELLGKTGTIVSFWMDHIKTHCYVTYPTVEEAVETRNAVYNLQWPPNGGHFLVAEFVDPCEVRMKVEATQTPIASTKATPFPSAPPTLPPPASSCQSRQQLALPSLQPLPHLSSAREAMEQLPPPPPSPVLDKLHPPTVTLDDLFRKTEATPWIYYLPLPEELVSEKLAAQGKGAKIF